MSTRCATEIGAPQKIQKNLKIEKNIFFENHKNQNNVKKLFYFNFFRILSHEEHIQITIPNLSKFLLILLSYQSS
jgi:hypothetical protein